MVVVVDDDGDSDSAGSDEDGSNGEMKLSTSFMVANCTGSGHAVGHTCVQKIFSMHHGSSIG